MEEKLAKSMGSLTAKHRKELVKLLGSPPRYDNIPKSFWKKVEDDVKAELATALLLIFSESATQHGWAGDDATVAAEGWAAERAESVAESWVETGKDMVRTASDRWESYDEPPTTAEISEDTLSAFGPDRVARAAENETTVARHQGSEVAVEATTGLSDGDLWVNTGSNVCPVCRDLDGKPRSYWEKFFPGGPPDPHVSCKCYIEYVNE